MDTAAVTKQGEIVRSATVPMRTASGEASKIEKISAGKS